jgi:hypothetical protein
MTENGMMRIAQLERVGDHALEIQWENGRKFPVDLRETVFRLKGLRPLRDPRMFARFEIGDNGRSVTWPDDIDMGADRLFELALEQNGRSDTAEFIRWRWRNGLSLSGAAEALRIDRRTVAYYISGEREVPWHILLACTGWEARKAGWRRDAA